MSVLKKSKNNADFQKKMDVVEEVLQALEIPYNVPDKEEMNELVKQFKDAINHNPDVKVKVKPKYVEVQRYVNAGYAGDWWDSDVYSYFGFRNLVEFEKTH